MPSDLNMNKYCFHHHLLAVQSILQSLNLILFENIPFDPDTFILYLQKTVLPIKMLPMHFLLYQQNIHSFKFNVFVMNYFLNYKIIHILVIIIQCKSLWSLRFIERANWKHKCIFGIDGLQSKLIKDELQSEQPKDDFTNGFI